MRFVVMMKYTWDINIAQPYINLYVGNNQRIPMSVLLLVLRFIVLDAL